MLVDLYTIIQLELLLPKCKKLLSQNARNTCPSVARRPPSTLETSTGLLGEAGQERVEDLERSLHLVTGRVFR